MAPSFKGRAVVLAGGVATATLLGFGLLQRVTTRTAIDVLGELAVANGRRVIQPRLSFDLPYAAFDAASMIDRADTLTKKNPKLMSEALTLTGHEPLRELLLGKTTEIDRLSPIDQSAAYYTRGLKSQSLTDFARALQALSTAPDSPAATFNRALIFEQLSDMEAAANEWRKYLAADSSSPWAKEARQHLDVASRPSIPEQWKADKPRLVAAATTGDMPGVRALVARYPLGARHLVEWELLPAWGARGDGLSLIAARRCASVLAERGECLLRDAIRDVDASVDARLAHAWRLYGESHQLLENSSDHERVLDLDTQALRLGSSSPAFAAIVADDMANARYRNYDHAGALALITRTRATFAAHRDEYVALFARMDWLEGLIQFQRGEASQSLQLYDRALNAYTRLGETEYQSAQEINIASALLYLGDVRAGVHLRKALFLGSQAEDARRLYATLKISADASLDDRAPVAALVFQDRFVRLARTTGMALRIADALVYRSSIFSQAGLRAEALRDVTEVMRLAEKTTNLPSRQRLQADASIAEAFAHRDADERAVIVSLTRAIDLLRNLQVPMKLAQLLLERGRAHLRLNEPKEAEVDFRAGIAELEHQRSLVRESDLRVSYLDRADTLFVDLAQLLLRRGQTEEAFDLLERLRSRELLDMSSGKPMTPMRAEEIRARLPLKTMLVSHTIAGNTLITCVVTRDGVRGFEQPAGNGALERRDLRRLGTLLIDRVAPASESRIVFIPDPRLNDVPFAALRTPSGRYLIEEHTIVVAPSATLYVRNCDRDRMLRKRGEPSLLAVASPQAPRGYGDLAPLTRATSEARTVAKSYERHRLIVASPDEQTPLLSIARDYDAVHFATHGVVDGNAPARSALLIGESGRLTAGEIESAPLRRVRLVVLAGCNTGIGKSRRTEGAMSLARAFMAASVPTVVGTIAKVDDEAAERLLTEFHRGYSAGLDAAAALRRAQLKMLHGGNHADTDPATWSAFEVIGGTYAPEREREEVAKLWPLR